MIRRNKPRTCAHVLSLAVLLGVTSIALADNASTTRGHSDTVGTSTTPSPDVSIHGSKGDSHEGGMNGSGTNGSMGSGATTGTGVGAGTGAGVGTGSQDGTGASGGHGDTTGSGTSMGSPSGTGSGATNNGH